MTHPANTKIQTSFFIFKSCCRTVSLAPSMAGALDAYWTFQSSRNIDAKPLIGVG
jgi:hypothetical protein